MRRAIVLMGMLFILLVPSPPNPLSSSAGPRSWLRPAEAGRGGEDTAWAARAHLSFQRLWVHSMSLNADSSPAYLAHPHGHSGAILYVLAGNNTSNCNEGDPVREATLSALDVKTGHALWTRSTSGPSRCTTAGPVVDPSGTWVYAPGLDGKMHRYDAVTGKESRGQGWPRTVTLMPDVEKVSATPTVARGYLYVATSGFIGDQGHYQGHLVTIKLSNGRMHVFNSLCSNVRTLLGPASGRANYCSFATSGLFGRGQGVTDPANHDVYIVSGNGPWNGRTNWGDSILKIGPAGSTLIDSYTPTDQAYLQRTDQDLGSSGPAILPPITSGGRTYHLLVQAGKGPVSAGGGPTALRLLNRDNLSGQGGPGYLGGDLEDVSTPGGCEVLTAPAVRQNVVYYANGCGLVAYRLTSPSPGKFSLDRVWSSRTGGTTPVLAGGVLYVAHSGQIVAYNPSNGAELAHLGGLGGIHWEYPLIRQGRLFITDESGKVYAYRAG